MAQPRNFRVGSQPCNWFVSKNEDHRFPGNEHECFGPWPRGDQPRCCGTVSFCSQCGYDHHDQGWNTCPHPEQPRNEE